MRRDLQQPEERRRRRRRGNGIGILCPEARCRAAPRPPHLRTYVPLPEDAAARRPSEQACLFQPSANARRSPGTPHPETPAAAAEPPVPERQSQWFRRFRAPEQLRRRLPHPSVPSGVAVPSARPARELPMPRSYPNRPQLDMMAQAAFKAVRRSSFRPRFHRSSRAPLRMSRRAQHHGPATINMVMRTVQRPSGQCSCNATCASRCVRSRLKCMGRWVSVFVPPRGRSTKRCSTCLVVPGPKCPSVRRTSWWLARPRTSTRSTRRAARPGASRFPRGRSSC